jgi:hypothetical protein
MFFGGKQEVAEAFRLPNKAHKQWHGGHCPPPLGLALLIQCNSVSIRSKNILCKRFLKKETEVTLSNYQL